jgi:serine protease inhibitor
VTLGHANTLWAADGYPFEHDYVTFVQDTFGATLHEVDLGAQESADRIDEWVTDRTEGLIEQPCAPTRHGPLTARRSSQARSRTPGNRRRGR